MITERTKAILLLTSYFTKSSDRELKPLSNGEWNSLVRWIQTKDINPEDFLNQDIDSLLYGWDDLSITKERIVGLMDRKPALALALDKWVRVGVWVINRGDSLYPKKIRDRLKEKAPPILFGIGNIELLNKNYIGVVGSRKTGESELEETKRIGSCIGAENYGVVSGGAKGIDETAMLGTLEVGGFSVGFVADSLIRKSTSGIFRNHIIKNRLCLVSPFNPEAGFSVGNAMARNRLIYTQSDATIIVTADTKGGTWEGSKENIKKKWVPIWVCDFKEKGNEALISLGARRLPLNEEVKIHELTSVDTPIIEQPDLFSSVNQAVPIPKPKDSVD